MNVPACFSVISLSCQTAGRSLAWRCDGPTTSWYSCWWKQCKVSAASTKSMFLISHSMHTLQSASRRKRQSHRLCHFLLSSDVICPNLFHRALLPALSCVQTYLLHLLDMNWEVHDLPLFLNIKLPDLLLSMAKDNISVHDIAVRYNEAHQRQ